MGNSCEETQMCLSAYMSISLMLYFNLSKVLTSGRD